MSNTLSQQFLDPKYRNTTEVIERPTEMFCEDAGGRLMILDHKKLNCGLLSRHSEANSTYPRIARSAEKPQVLK